MKEKIKAKLLEDNVRFIRLQFSDLLGTMKNVEVPISQIDSILDGETMFDGSSIEGFVRINESDMFLKPDLSSYTTLAWEKPNDWSKVGSFMCDIYKTDGTPFEGDPRFILKKAVNRMNELGFDSFNIGLEPEFFLFKKGSDGFGTTEFTDKGGYFDLAPHDAAIDCRRNIVIELEDMGFEIEASHHEVSQSQHEINFKYDSALKCCDNVQLFKLAVKNIAALHDMHATFMPKPINGINGSGMHANLSLTKNGINSFYDENSESGLSITAYHFIGGLLEHATSFTALTNPTVNSYKRLVKGYEAPVFVTYSESNRSAMVRIPATRKAGTRVEVRSVDPTANPYLAMAAMLHAGLDGIEKQTNPGESCSVNLFKSTTEEIKAMNIVNLPSSLNDALKHLKKSDLMRESLGEHTFNLFIENKSLEYSDYRRTVSKWELENYLNQY